jgi:2-desacetyl-2-hydroxyethyl bacteriochlorophyllide A dehydrogenase
MLFPILWSRSKEEIVFVNVLGMRIVRTIRTQHMGGGVLAKQMMQAVSIGQDHSVRVIETEIPELSAGEILVKPCSCGICGTDLHILRHGFPGTNYPVIPGHEFAGHVAAVGKGVTGLREGDFVAVDPNVVCGTCRWCRAGRPNLCVQLTPIGVGRPGAAAEFVNVPAKNAFAVKETIGRELGALIEPLACVIHAVESSQGVKNRTVLVLGGGTMGLLTAIMSDVSGASRVVLADPSPNKRQIAQKAGIKETVDPATLGSECFDVVFEAAGVRAALENAMKLVEKTGVVVQIGVHDEDAIVGFIPFKIYEREIRIIGSNSCADKYVEAVDVMSDIRDRASKLVGKSFSVWDFNQAVDSMAAGDSIKTLLHFNS